MERLEWKDKLRSKGTNPNWGKEKLEAIIKELDNRERPDIGYIVSKLQSFDRFLDDVRLVE